MNFVVWMAVGALVGGAAGLRMRSDDAHGMFFNLVVGVIGAMLAGWFGPPLLGWAAIDLTRFSLAAMGMAAAGAAVLVAVMNLVRQGSEHWATLDLPDRAGHNPPARCDQRRLAGGPTGQHSPRSER